MKTIKRKDTLKDLHNKIIKCKLCKGIKSCVCGYGSLKAELMVIGQSLHSYNPETPDRQIPFVGPSIRYDSGDLLYTTLNQIGYSFNKKNLFVTNILKGHPSKNRKSEKYEIKNCSLYLKKEIELVKPKIILTLGTDARKWFNLPRIIQPYYSMTWQDAGFMNDMIFVIAYHPSYMRRSGKHKLVHKYKEHLDVSLNTAKKKNKEKLNGR